MSDRNTRRRFNKIEKFAVELVTGKSGEGDHIKPYSKGGATLIENCQLLNKQMNQKKAAFNFEPRKWQSAFFEKWDKREDGRPFMLIAIPGSGKTFSALEVARCWMAGGADRRVIIVVPTDNLRNQWQSEAALFGADLQTKEFGTKFKDGYQGGVVTYHLVANQPLVFRKLCAVAPTMVIFDEIHHCGDETHFGQGIKEGFELAKEKLLMSGTPWKSDGNPIPFVRYDSGGYALGDYRYDYPDALADEVVRYLVFDHAKGSIKNGFTGEVSEVSDQITDIEASKRLRPLLDPDGEYIKQQITDAHKKLIECRRVIPDAAGLVVCIDQFHAAKIARIIKDVSGCDPSVIVSDSDMENDSVESFRKSKKEWLVSVRKVSEGTDIKRLQVLCYATNVTAELFFRQVIGRVSRVRDLEDYEGYVYLPADPRLIAAARNIENAQVLAIKEAAERHERESKEKDGFLEEFTTWETSHGGTETILIGSEEVPLLEYREMERIAEATGVSVTKIREIKQMMAPAPIAAPEVAKQQPTREQKESELRSLCNKLANQLARISGTHVGVIHGKFRPQGKMSLVELERKKRQLIEQIRKA